MSARIASSRPKRRQAGGAQQRRQRRAARRPAGSGPATRTASTPPPRRRPPAGRSRPAGGIPCGSGGGRRRSRAASRLASARMNQSKMRVGAKASLRVAGDSRRGRRRRPATGVSASGAWRRCPWRSSAPVAQTFSVMLDRGAAAGADHGGQQRIGRRLARALGDGGVAVGELVVAEAATSSAASAGSRRLDLGDLGGVVALDHGLHRLGAGVGGVLADQRGGGAEARSRPRARAAPAGSGRTRRSVSSASKRARCSSSCASMSASWPAMRAGRGPARSTARWPR